jgi:hypothetical protein
MNGWYKMEPLKWDRGTDDLTLEQEAAFLRVVNAINAAHQPIRENYRMLAGMWRCHERRAKRLVAELVAAGKIEIADGWITNRKAMKVMEARLDQFQKRAAAGREGGLAKAVKANETGMNAGSAGGAPAVDVPCMDRLRSMKGGHPSDNQLKSQGGGLAIATSRKDEKGEEKKDESAGALSWAPGAAREGEAPSAAIDQQPKDGEPAAVAMSALVGQPPSPLAGFPEFWELYPHRDGAKRKRADAEKVYAKAVRNGVEPATILAGARAAHCQPDVIRGYARDPTTWLNQKGWEDQPPDPDRIPHGGHLVPRRPTDRDLRARRRLENRLAAARDY